jgi:general L-amino acid transport system permease protein
LTARQWLSKNLFGTWYNTLLTLISGALIVFVLKGTLTWVLLEANWEPVARNLKLFAVGQYPSDQLWRVGGIVLIVSFMLGLSWRVWGGTVRTFAITLALLLGLLALLPVHMPLSLRLWFLANPAVTFAGYQTGRTPVGRSRWVALGWLLAAPVSIGLLMGIGGVRWLPCVESGLWGGLLLTFLLALVGIIASFPLSILLALGRRSSLPVLKAFCIAFIEVIRGVPLVTLLFMASIILPLFLPEEVRIDRVLRAMLGMTLFSAAYTAENIRGGLQAIPQGQYDAAKAIGLNGAQTTLLIVLPQALRAVIPAIVGQFIALFMDTTLALTVGLLELLAVGRAVLESNADWKLLNMEVYLFIAAVFWVFNYAMSYASRRLEDALGVGKR